MTYIQWLEQAKTKKIGQHFTLYDVGYSQTAVSKGINNIPSQTIVNNATALILKVLEPIRNHFNCPVTVNCIYRSKELKIGVPTSQHCTGEASDIVIKGKDLKMVFYWVKANLKFDQLILEITSDGSWIHVSYASTGKNRQQSLKFDGKKYINA